MPEIDLARSDIGAVAMSFRDLVLAPGRAAMSGEIRAGEILGLAGLEGQGQERFLHVLAGLASGFAGRAYVGEPGTIEVTGHRQVARNGIAYLPRDRRTSGIFPLLSILDNFGLPSMSRCSTFGIVSRRRQRERLTQFADFLSIRYADLKAPITTLSGGNQQKVLLARWLALEPRVFLLNDPTRGVDLNTRLKFYDAFRELAASSGIALVILSSEVEEVLEVCDRVFVFRNFELYRELPRAALTMDTVMASMFGQETAA
jgi:ribose transport system ATP-binding protein